MIRDTLIQVIVCFLPELINTRKLSRLQLQALLPVSERHETNGPRRAPGSRLCSLGITWVSDHTPADTELFKTTQIFGYRIILNRMIKARELRALNKVDQS